MLKREIILALLGTLLSVAIAASARAQDSISPPPAVDAATLQDLSKATKNPVASFIKVPFQFTTGFGVGSRHDVGESLNIQPVLPISLNADWDLIARPSLNVTYSPSPHEQFGLQDLQTSFFLTPDKASAWFWGAGPIFQFPSATSKELGTGRWSAGPTAALLYSKGPWFNGILTYQLLSFAGNRNRGSVNQTYIEPLVSYNFESGWSVQCDPAITYDWTANMANAWVLPVGADVGQTLQIGDRALSLQVGGYDLLKYPEGAPQWIIRVQMTFVFPG